MVLLFISMARLDWVRSVPAVEVCVGPSASPERDSRSQHWLGQGLGAWWPGDEREEDPDPPAPQSSQAGAGNNLSSEMIVPGRVRTLVRDGTGPGSRRTGEIWGRSDTI